MAKVVLGVPTTSALIERLDVDKSLRRILGWERRSQVPSEATFSRAFAEFARGELPDKIHAALIKRALGGRIIGAIARDATVIEAREKPVQKKANDGKDGLTSPPSRQQVLELVTPHPNASATEDSRAYARRPKILGRQVHFPAGDAGHNYMSKPAGRLPLPPIRLPPAPARAQFD